MSLVFSATQYTIIQYERNGQGEMSMTVPGIESSVAIPACVLMSGVKYQFQVAATAEFRGRQFVGDRSMVDKDTRITNTPQSPLSAGMY